MPSDATVILVGHIGEPKFQQVGEALVARFGLATSRKRKDTEATTWWNCTCWRKDAEFLQKYAKKGNLLSVHGDAHEEEYEGKKSLKVEVRKVMILTAKSEQEAAAPAPMPSPAPRRPLPAAGGGDQDPPFNRYYGADIAG